MNERLPAQVEHQENMNAGQPIHFMPFSLYCASWPFTLPQEAFEARLRSQGLLPSLEAETQASALPYTPEPSASDFAAEPLSSHVDWAAELGCVEVPESPCASPSDIASHRRRSDAGLASPPPSSIGADEEHADAELCSSGAAFVDCWVLARPLKTSTGGGQDGCAPAHGNGEEALQEAALTPEVLSLISLAVAQALFAADGEMEL